jgi:hypothetical protein
MISSLRNPRKAFVFTLPVGTWNADLIVCGGVQAEPDVYTKPERILTCQNLM